MAETPDRIVAEIVMIQTEARRKGAGKRPRLPMIVLATAEEVVLSPDEARKVYDRIGRAQDTQAFYEDRATAELIPHLELADAQSVFEFGCGTGRFAASTICLNRRPIEALT
jgi:hypothetical protein